MTLTTAGTATAMPHHFRVFALFFTYSLILGGILSRVADVQHGMGISEGTLGLGLLGMALGTQIVLITGGRLVERLGPRRTVFWATPLLAAGQILASLAPGVSGFFLALTAAGFGIGALEIVLNLEADRAEYALGRRLMSRAHSFWSFGFFAAGMLGAAAAGLGVAPVWHLIAVDALAVLATWWLVDGFRPAPARVATEAAVSGFVAPTIGILGIVAITLSAMLIEGAANDWSIIYMRDTFATAPAISGLAFALGAFAQAITRFFADPVVDRFGPVAVARVLFSLMGIGCLMVTFAAFPGMALAGFVLMGIGTSSIFPLAVSAAARRTDRPAAVNIAALAQTAFIVFLIAPPLLGFIAEHFGIRLSFGIALPLIAISLIWARKFAPS